MKIQVDLNEILGDEFGSTENLAESIKRQVVDSIRTEMDKGIKKQIDEKISEILNERVKEEINKKMPEFLSELFDAEYYQVDRWGQATREKTTFRKQMIKSITENMVYAPEHYRERENAFTSAVRSVLAEESKRFEKEFKSVVDAEFTKKTVELVTTELRKKFGL